MSNKLPAAIIAFAVFFTLSGCSTTAAPKGVKPVTEFELSSYLGKWHEIARLDHKFERGLSEVTAEYTLRKGGGVTVTNRGLSSKSGKVEVANGKAFFVADPTTGHLKVSFFGPFYGAYVIMELDKEDYQYSMVAGPDRSYLWILSREPVMEKETFKRLVALAKSKGFPTKELIILDDTQIDP